MPKTDKIVINTSPLIALVAALGELKILQDLYSEVFVPFEVCQEVEKGYEKLGFEEFRNAIWLSKQTAPTNISTLLVNSLDIGEASVIQLALDRNIETVCIDEAKGRRIARLSGLSLTGSIGILLRAKQEGYPLSIKEAIHRMLSCNIRLSRTVIDFALKIAREDN